MNHCVIFLSGLILVKACVPSVTTVKSLNSTESFCSGDLIFDDNFDDLNTTTWKHQHTLAGGGNWEVKMILIPVVLKINLLFYL